MAVSALVRLTQSIREKIRCIPDAKKGPPGCKNFRNESLRITSKNKSGEQMYKRIEEILSI